MIHGGTSKSPNKRSSSKLRAYVNKHLRSVERRSLEAETLPVLLQKLQSIPKTNSVQNMLKINRLQMRINALIFEYMKLNPDLQHFSIPAERSVSPYSPRPSRARA